MSRRRFSPALAKPSQCFFIKYLDQTNITNAYVSGMKEDLGLCTSTPPFHQKKNLKKKSETDQKTKQKQTATSST